MNNNNQRPYGSLPHGASRLKRKDRDSSSLPPAKRPPQPPPPPPRASVASSTRVTNSKTATNKLLAGYMAYEYLTKGTVLGHNYKPKADNDNDNDMKVNGKEKYEEVTSLLMMMKTEGGDHVSGIVNPTELHRWIGM